MENNKNTTEYKALVRNFFNYFESGTPDRVVDELLTNGYKLHISGKPTTQSVQESRDLMMEYKTAFPDLKFSFLEQIAEGNWVVSHVKMTGTHTGKFQGILPTNNKIDMTAISIHRFENGKISEEWTVFDSMNIFKQLGLVKGLATI
jgi:steroid delta-isomerase-like uncharacterized protein